MTLAKAANQAAKAINEWILKYDERLLRLRIRLPETVTAIEGAAAEELIQAYKQARKGT